MNEWLFLQTNSMPNKFQYFEVIECNLYSVPQDILLFHHSLRSHKQKFGV